MAYLVLPTWRDGDPFSATYANQVSKTLRAVKAVADSTRNPSKELELTDNEIVTGVIQHSYNTLQYTLNNSGTTTITVNGNTLSPAITASGVTSGSYDLTSLSLIEGNFYPVTVISTSSNTVVRLLYEELTETYSAPPDFSTVAAVDVAANLNQMTDLIRDLVNLAQSPPTTLKRGRSSQSFFQRETDTALVTFAGWLKHIHETMTFRFYHTANAGGTASQKSSMLFRVNGTLVFNHQSGNPSTATKTVQRITGTPTGPGQNAKAERVYGTADLSSLGLTVGTFYRWEVTQKAAGTDQGVDLSAQLEWLGEVNQSTSSWVNPPKWSHSGQNVNANRLNTWSNDIDLLYPGSGSEESPMYYENHVQWYTPGETTVYLEKRKKYLVYESDGTGTPQIFYGAGSTPFQLKAATGYQWTDLDSVPGLFYGNRFKVDDVKFAIQTEDVSGL